MVAETFSESDTISKCICIGIRAQDKTQVERLQVCFTVSPGRVTGP